MVDLLNMSLKLQKFTKYSAIVIIFAIVLTFLGSILDYAFLKYTSGAILFLSGFVVIVHIFYFIKLALNKNRALVYSLVVIALTFFGLFFHDLIYPGFLNVV